MYTYTLQMHVQDPRGDDMIKAGRPLSVSAESIADVRKKARALADQIVQERGWPPVRSMNLAPENKVIVYCGPKESRAQPPAGVNTQWRRPPGGKRA